MTNPKRKVGTEPALAFHEAMDRAILSLMKTQGLSPFAQVSMSGITRELRSVKLPQADDEIATMDISAPLDRMYFAKKSFDVALYMAGVRFRYDYKVAHVSASGAARAVRR